MVFQAAEPFLEHGGDLSRARRLFPDAPRPFIDLSTGINPYSCPLPPLAPALFARLPQPDALDRLADVAAEAYGAPSPACIVAAPGTQSLLPLIAALGRIGRAAILGPTYAEHALAARRAGHRVIETPDLDGLRDADIAVVVNPNNPTGRVLSRADLRALAEELKQRGGLLVVDEAFMDVGPPAASLAPEVMRGGIVVLRSFGKFFGLAGVRLGFAIAAPEITARLRAALGPWAVSGPALAIGAPALADQAWQNETRERLASAARRLDALLIGAGLDHDGFGLTRSEVINVINSDKLERDAGGKPVPTFPHPALAILGGTTLFRLAQSSTAPGLFERLGRAGILVRRFAGHPDWLRFGLPGGEDEWDRLTNALVTAAATHTSPAR